MDHDGRDSDDADWLLAQLANDRPVRQAPPVTPAPTEPPAPAPASRVQPRREESLDWFSLADAAPEPDAATQALPLIGASAANDDPVPPAAAPLPPAAPAAQAAPASPAAPLFPAPPAVPPPASSSPLTSVEPPVGRAPRSNELPPGPVTPPNPFALTWGDDRSLDTEDAVRAAFRNLSQSGEHPVAPDAASPSSEPDRPLPSPASAPESPAVSPTGAASSPFAGYSAPPVARQTFTPVGGNPIVGAPQPEPPRHPIAPITAPAGWGEQRTPAEPLQPTPLPAPAEPAQASRPVSRPSDEYDHELWSALVEPEPQAPAVPAWAPSAPARPAAATPPQPAEARGLPSLDARGDAGSESAPVGAPAAGSAAGRVPFPAFASADDPAEREPRPAEPVDDLLAALGGGASAPSERRPAPPETQATASSSLERGATPPPSGGGDGLDALGIDFGDDASDGHADDAANAGRAENDDERGAENDDEIDVESPIAREIAETGYFWNLTPDPSAPDPKAEAGPVGLERPSPLAPYAADDATEVLPVDPAPTSLLPSPADAAEEPPAETPPAPMPDAFAALFGGAAATQAASAPAAASAAGSAGAAASPFAASAAATGPAFAATSASATRPAAAPTAAPRSAGSGGAGGGSRPTRGGGGNDRRAVRTLLWIAGSLVVLVVLAALFLLGTRLAPAGGDAAASGSPDATTASETPVPEPTAAQPPGVHAWNTLFGGECLEPFPSAWENEYTVVDCAAPHAAQLVFRGELAGDAAAPFPGEEALAAQMADLCRADGIIDPALVAGMNDLQVAGSYPVESQWAEGERTFYCFANRSGGEPLTGGIMGPGPAA